MRDEWLRALDAGLTVRAAPGVVLHRDGGEPSPGGLPGETVKQFNPFKQTRRYVDVAQSGFSQTHNIGSNANIGTRGFTT